MTSSYRARCDVREGVVAEFGGQRTSGLLMMHLMIRFRRADRAGLPDVRRGLAGHKADRHPSTGLMMSSVHGRGSSGFEDVPVLGAVKIVRPVGRCILTAPALRRRWPAVEEPRDVSNQTVTG
jgi:hypothetical protein